MKSMRISLVCQDRFQKASSYVKGEPGGTVCAFCGSYGFEGAIKETARVTGEKIELDETQKTFLDENLRYCCAKNSRPLYVFSKKMNKKRGGAYITVSGIVKKRMLIPIRSS